MRQTILILELGALLWLPIVGCAEQIHNLGGFDGGSWGDLSAPDGALRPDLASDASAVDAALVDGATGPQVVIVVTGDPTAKTISDGLAGQTPRNYRMAFGAFRALKDLNDPAPLELLDYRQAPREVDLSQRTVVGSASLASLAAGSYTYGEVLLTKAQFEVDATIHFAGQSIAQSITVVAALSDTTIAGKAWKQGEAQVTVPIIGQPYNFSLPALPSTAGGTLIQKNGETWMRFAFGKPLLIDPQQPTGAEAEIIYETYESFRWQDTQQSGHQPNLFDITAGLPPLIEPVLNFGATGYRVITR
ncbi:MAG: hypothetical protein H6707_13545 [Deltaproteobacteria bacterium]|nr:hypothetical protein [Deltaproteobacteria bacterium]